MTTKDFTKNAEGFTKNVNQAMKWFQDSTATMLETQSKQMEFATEMFSKTMKKSFDELNKGKLNNSFVLPEKMLEMMRKNMENITTISETTMKSMMEFGKQTESIKYSEEMLKTITDTFNKQVDVILDLNTQSFDVLKKQFETSKIEFSPLFETSKKEFEANIASSKKIMKEMIGSYTKLNEPTIEAQQKLIDELTKKMSTLTSNNVKFWSVLMEGLKNKSNATNHQSNTTNHQ